MNEYLRPLAINEFNNQWHRNSTLDNVIDRIVIAKIYVKQTRKDQRNQVASPVRSVKVFELTASKHV